MTRRLLPYIGLVLAAFSLFSCKKKEEETTTKPYLYGVSFDLPTFARPGDSFDLKAYGVYTTEGDGVENPTYKWRIGTDAFQEAEVFTVKLEEVGNFTITCQASDPDDNYYATSVSHTIIVIDPTLGKTLTGTGIDAADNHITDTRDKAGENDYFYTRIGNLTGSATTWPTRVPAWPTRMPTLPPTPSDASTPGKKP